MSGSPQQDEQLDTGVDWIQGSICHGVYHRATMNLRGILGGKAILARCCLSFQFGVEACWHSSSSRTL